MPPTPTPIPDAVLQEAADVVRAAFRGRNFPEEVTERLVHAVMNEACMPGTIEAQRAESGPILDALAVWDGAGSPPEIAADMIGEIASLAAGMQEYYRIIADDPAGFLAAKARAFYVIQSRMG